MENIIKGHQIGQKSHNNSISNSSLVSNHNLLQRQRGNSEGDQIHYYSGNELWDKGRDNLKDTQVRRSPSKSLTSQDKSPKIIKTKDRLGKDNLDLVDNAARKSLNSKFINHVRSSDQIKQLDHDGLQMQINSVNVPEQMQNILTVNHVNAFALNKPELNFQPQQIKEVVSIQSDESIEEEAKVPTIQPNRIEQKKIFEIEKIIQNIGQTSQRSIKSQTDEKENSQMDDNFSLDQDLQNQEGQISQSGSGFKGHLFKNKRAFKLNLKTAKGICSVTLDGLMKDIQDISQLPKQDEVKCGQIIQAPKKVKAKGQNPQQKDKEFYKAMQKIKDRHVTNQPPKKPASAYIIFQKEKRAQILQRSPNSKVTEVVKEIAQCWRNLIKEQRQPYKEQARKDKERYEKQIKKLEDCSSNLHKPKKCLSAYMIFVKETRPIIVNDNPGLGALEVMKRVGEVWQQLLVVENGTKYFQDKADHDKQRYLQEQRDFYDEVERIHSKDKEDEVEIFEEFQDDQIEQLEGVESMHMNNNLTNKNKRRMSMPTQPNPIQKRQRLNSQGSKTNEKKTTPTKQEGEKKLKKPLNAYQLFMKEYKTTFKKMVKENRESDMKACDLQKRCQNEWQILPKHEKQNYEQRALNDRKVYHQKMKEVDDKKKLLRIKSNKQDSLDQIESGSPNINLDIKESPRSIGSSKSENESFNKNQLKDDFIKKKYSDDSSLKLQIQKQIGITTTNQSMKTRPRQFSDDFQNKHTSPQMVQNNQNTIINNKQSNMKMEDMQNPFNQMVSENMHQGNTNQQIIQGLNNPLNDNILDAFDLSKMQELGAMNENEHIGFNDASNSPFARKQDKINDNVFIEFSKDKYRMDKSDDKNYQYDQIGVFDDINVRQSEALMENPKPQDVNKQSGAIKTPQSQNNMLSNNLMLNQLQNMNNQNLSVFNNILKNQIINNFHQQSGGMTNMLNGLFAMQNANIVQSLQGNQNSTTPGNPIQQSIQGINQLIGSNSQLIGSIDQSNLKQLQNNQNQLNLLSTQAQSIQHTANPQAVFNSAMIKQSTNALGNASQNQLQGLNLLNLQNLNNYSQLPNNGKLSQGNLNQLSGNVNLNALQNQMINNSLQFLNTPNTNLGQQSQQLIHKQQQQLLGIKASGVPTLSGQQVHMQRSQSMSQLQQMSNSNCTNTARTGTFAANNANKNTLLKTQHLTPQNRQSSQNLQGKDLILKQKSVSNQPFIQQTNMVELIGNKQNLNGSQKNQMQQAIQSQLNSAQVGQSNLGQPSSMIQVGSGTNQTQANLVNNQIDANTIHQLQQHIILQQQQLLEQFMQQNQQQMQQQQIATSPFVGGVLSGNATQQPQPSTGVIGGAQQQYGLFGGRNSNSDISNTSNTQRNNNRSSNSQSKYLNGILSMQMGYGGQNNSTFGNGANHQNNFSFMNNQVANSPNLTFNGQHQYQNQLVFPNNFIIEDRGNFRKDHHAAKTNIGALPGVLASNYINTGMISPNRIDNDSSLVGGCQFNMNGNSNFSGMQIPYFPTQNQPSTGIGGLSSQIGNNPYIIGQHQSGHHMPPNYGHSVGPTNINNINLNLNLQNINSAVPALKVQNQPNHGANSKEEKVFTPSNYNYKD